MFSFCLDHGLFGFYLPIRLIRVIRVRFILSIRLIRVIRVRFILSLRPNGYPRPLLANAKVAIQREQS